MTSWTKAIEDIIGENSTIPDLLYAYFGIVPISNKDSDLNLKQQNFLEALMYLRVKQNESTDTGSRSLIDITPMYVFESGLAIKTRNKCYIDDRHRMDEGKYHQTALAILFMDGYEGLNLLENHFSPEAFVPVNHLLKDVADYEYRARLFGSSSEIQKIAIDIELERTSRLVRSSKPLTYDELGAIQDFYVPMTWKNRLHTVAGKFGSIVSKDYELKNQ